MSNNLIDLTKKVTIVLEKKNIANVTAQVGFAIDVSTSMRDLFNNGTMTEVINRIQAIANKFDDNASLDTWIFNNNAYELEPATPKLFGSYVEKVIYKSGNMWGGTSYAPVLNMINEHYFNPSAPVTESKKPFSIFNIFSSKKEEPVVAEAAEVVDFPVYLLMLTDGENFDKSDTINMIENLQNKNIYIQFIAIGTDTNFSFIQNVADKYPNVGIVRFTDVQKVDDETMYEQLLNDEFVQWVKKFSS